MKTLIALSLCTALLALAGCGGNGVYTAINPCNDQVCEVNNAFYAAIATNYWRGSDATSTVLVDLSLYSDGTGRIRCLNGITSFGPDALTWQQTSPNSLRVTSPNTCGGLVPTVTITKVDLINSSAIDFIANVGTYPPPITFVLTKGGF